MENKMIEILTEVLPEADITECDDFFDEGLDSMGVMTIIAMIEEAFEIEISPEDITADNFSNLSELINLVEKYKK